MKGVKKQRLEKQILRLMAEIYFRELKNPDLGYATFTRCQLSSDFSRARIYVSVLEGQFAGAPVGDGAPESVQKTIKALQRARGFVKGKLGRALGIRTIPEIEFVLDTSFAQGEHVDRLIEREIAAIQPPGNVPDSTDAAATGDSEGEARSVSD